MNLSCTRCGKVLPLEVHIEDSDESYSAAPDESGAIPDRFEVDIATPPGGILTAICTSCSTQREAHQRLMQLASNMLDVNERYVEDVTRIIEVVPAMGDDAKVKASIAEARQRVIEARAWLQALTEAESELED